MKKLLAALLLTAGLGFGAQVSVGIRFGTPPPPPRVYRRPPPPAPGYFWVDGYWYPNGRRYVWHNGYWSRPPYEGARWIGHVTRAECFITVIGRATVDVSNTIIVGTEIATATGATTGTTVATAIRS